MNNRLRMTAAALAVLLLTSAFPAALAKHDHDDDNDRLTPRQEQIIRDWLDRYYREHGRGRDDDDDRWKHGKTWNANNLPPGIRKRLAEGKPLPPGIRKKMVTLPTSLNTRLGWPQDVRMGVLDDDLIVYNPITQMILDIIRNF